MDTKIVQKPILGFQPLDREELSRFCSDKSIHALESSMSALRHGRAPTPSFKLYGKSDASVATDFLASIAKRSDVPKWMLDYEESRLAKWGPQGGHKPWEELLPGFILYYERPQKCNISESVLRLLLHKYAKLHLLALAVTDSLASLIATDKIQDRAAGWSTFELKKTDPTAQRIAVQLARSGEWKQGYAYVFSRFNKLKLRIFMPMPFSSMIVQAQYYQPFLRAIQTSLMLERTNSPFLFWADKIGLNNGEMLKLLNEAIYKKYRSTNLVGYTPLFVQRDFEKMDTTMGPSQYSKVVIPLIAAAFGFKESSEQYNRLYDVMQFTTTCPIITPDGIVRGDHGTASGAEVTNGGETLGNEAYDEEVQGELLNECVNRGIDYVLMYTLGNGDDGASLYYVKDSQINDFKQIYTIIANAVAKRHGYRVQAQKWHLSEEFGIYCQYLLWLEQPFVLAAPKLHQMYPAVLVLNAICNPEKQYTKSEWDKDYRDLDIIAKLDNASGAPYFHDLVNYVDKGMKFRLLGRSENETKRILSKYESWKNLQDPSEFFNKKIYSVDSSPTIQYLLNSRR